MQNVQPVHRHRPIDFKCLDINPWIRLMIRSTCAHFLNSAIFDQYRAESLEDGPIGIAEIAQELDFCLFSEWIR